MGSISSKRRRNTVIIVDTIEEVITQHNASMNQNQNQNLEIILITKIENSEEVCPICREIMSEEVVKTECGHTYHKDCIVAWLRIGEGHRRFKCPICVQDLSI